MLSCPFIPLWWVLSLDEVKFTFDFFQFYSSALVTAYLLSELFLARLFTAPLQHGLTCSRVLCASPTPSFTYSIRLLCSVPGVEAPFSFLLSSES